MELSLGNIIDLGVLSVLSELLGLRRVRGNSDYVEPRVLQSPAQGRYHTGLSQVLDRHDGGDEVRGDPPDHSSAWRNTRSNTGAGCDRVLSR